MKKIITVLMFTILISSGLFAQETLRDIVKDYQNENSELTVVVPSFLIKMGMAFGDIDEEDREVLEHIDNMKIVICENRFHKSDFYKLEEGIKTGNFAEVITVQEHNQKVRIVLNERSKHKSEILMLVENDEENVLILMNVHGKPDFNKLISLAD